MSPPQVRTSSYAYDCYLFSDVSAPSLVSNLTNLTVPLCPDTIVQLTCTTVNTTNHKWFREGPLEFASYEFSPGDEFPRDPTVKDPSASGINIQITSAVQLSDPNRFNATSVLTANVSTLAEVDIESVLCGEERGTIRRLSNPITLKDVILSEFE